MIKFPNGTLMISYSDAIERTATILSQCDRQTFNAHVGKYADVISALFSVPPWQHEKTPGEVTEDLFAQVEHIEQKRRREVGTDTDPAAEYLDATNGC